MNKIWVTGSRGFIGKELVSLLKQNDSVKLVYDDYKLYCASIQNMQKVTPDNYKYDIYE